MNLKCDSWNVELDELVKERDRLIVDFCEKYSIPFDDFILFDYQYQLIYNKSVCVELKQLIDSRIALKKLGGD